MGGSPAEAALTERLLERAPADYAPWLDRRRCRDAIERHGLPNARSETWRHTNARRWYEAALRQADCPVESETRIVAPKGVETVDFAQPRAAELAAAHRRRDLDCHPLAAVNRLLLRGGAAIRAPSGASNAVVRLQALAGAFQHVLVAVEAGASLTLIEEPAGYVCRVVEVVVQEGATCRHWRRQAAAADRQCSLIAGTVAADAAYSLAQTSRGAELRRNEVRISLTDEGAQAQVSGVWRLAGREHLDNQIVIEHEGPGGFSRQKYRGIADDDARAIQNGGIRIAPGADRSDAALDAKNLLASDRARVYAKPELVIDASDVQCSHGATVGALDDAALHYLRSRGIGEPEARALLLRGFLRAAIDDVEGAERIGLQP